MKKAIQNLSFWLVNLFLATALLLAAAVWLPEVFHMKAYVVKSSSMEPAIKAGSVIYVSQYDPDEPVCPGDIVSFQAGNVMVTHRVVSVDLENNTIVTKGDANAVCDAMPVSQKELYGKVRFQIPWIGYLLLR